MTCPQCGNETETLYKGYCEDCRNEEQQQLEQALFNESLIIIAALKAMKKERDALAAYAANLEKAGDDMLESSDGSILHCDAIRDWDAARKEKP
jgi:hypothetical protein